LHFAVANAGCAHTNSLTCALDERVNRLQIQIPTTLCHIVGMTNAVPELWSTTTDFTNLCHKNTLQLYP
jgi:hypothetical protein